MDDVKAFMLKIAEGFPAPPEIPLEEAPAPSYDLGVVAICPSCGSTYTRTEVAEGVIQGVCTTCGCEFCQPRESVAKRVVRSIMERERRRRHILDIPVIRHNRKRQTKQRHDTENTGVGVARQMVNDRITTDT